MKLNLPMCAPIGARVAVLRKETKESGGGMKMGGFGVVLKVQLAKQRHMEPIAPRPPQPSERKQQRGSRDSRKHRESRTVPRIPRDPRDCEDPVVEVTRGIARERSRSPGPRSRSESRDSRVSDTLGYAAAKPSKSLESRGHLVDTWRLYPETLPGSKDTAVVRYLRESPGIGTYVTLCEYGNIEGLIPAGQSSFPDRRTRGKARKFPKTKDVVVKVIRSSEHGIDLSRRVDADAKADAQRRYQKARRLRSFFRELLIYDPSIDAKTAMRWMHNLHTVAERFYGDEYEEEAEKEALDLVAEATRDGNPGILTEAGIDRKTTEAIFALLRKRNVLPEADVKDDKASAQVMIGCVRSGVSSVQKCSTTVFSRTRYHI